MDTNPLRRLAGLLDFEAAARHGSFRLAAAELHKTPAALSQQIKQLEAALGLALFQRHARHVAITPAGRELAATLARQLAELRAQIGALRLAQDPNLLRVSATHSFAMKWLLPRLPCFSQRHPAIDLRIEASDQLADLAGGACDVALRYQLPGAEPEALLYEEHWRVVYSPLLAPAAAGLAALRRLPLLHEGDTGPWLRLFAQQGQSSRHLDFSRSFSHGGLLVQAAVAGQGVALAPAALAHEDLQQGRLLAADLPPLPAGRGYRLLCNPARAAAPAVLAFTAWLQAELQAMRAAS